MAKHACVLWARKGLFIFLTLIMTSCFSEKKDPSGVVVLKVNHSSMDAKKFAELLSRELKSLTAVAVKDTPIVQTAKEKIINDFLLQVIFRDWAKLNKIKIHKDGEQGWQTAVDRVRKSYPDEISFRKSLSNEGLTYKEWTAKMRFSVLQKLVVKQLHENIEPPSEKEIKAYFDAHSDDFTVAEAVKIQQIVLRSEAEAKRIQKELKARKPMSELAKKFSITPEAANGGIVGWIERGTSPTFENAFSLAAGRRSDIVHSPYGYHIMMVLKKRRSRSLRFKEAKEQIKNILIEKREQAVYTAWLEEQLKKARVYKNIEAINAIKVKTKG